MTETASSTPRFLRALPALALALGMTLATSSAARSAELLADGSFEAATSGQSPSWSATANGPFATPFCTFGGTLACENGAGSAGPRNGDVWAWFGGSGAKQTQTITQKVTIPSGEATLSFYLWTGAHSGNGDESLAVWLDSTQLYGASQNRPDFYGGYKPVVSPVNDFADGKEHTLKFVYTNPTAEPPTQGLGRDRTTNMNVDDVSLVDVAVIPELPPDKSGGHRDSKPPKVTILRGPAFRTHKRRARFRVTSHENGVTYQCKLDRRRWRKCRSVTVYRGLKPGRHVFKARGIDKAGNVGPNARHVWRVLRRRR